MLTRALLTLAAFVAPTALAAQRVIPSASAPPRVGIMAGVNSSTFGGSDAGSPDHRTGFVGGLYLTLPLGTPLAAFRPEMLFSQQGAKGSFEGLTTDVRLGYLQVPLLVQLAIPTGGGVRPRVYAGPSLAFRTSCRVAVSGYYPVQVQNLPSVSTSFTTGCADSNTDIDLGAKTFDPGGVVGGQVNFDVGGRAVAAGARYTHGFNSITKYGTLKNRAVSVYGSLELPFGR